jgi:hypothetical protein
MSASTQSFRHVKASDSLLERALKAKLSLFEGLQREF